MIKKTLPVLILLALSGSFSTAVAADKKETQNFYYPETLDLTPLRLHSPESNPWVNRPGFPGECFICELRLPDHRFRWKHNKLFLLLPEEYGPAFPAIVDCYTSPPT
ncbi:outer membrane usher protein FimD [Escherichia coli O145:H28]|nr:outer membrane usher protein FimD [Escherichia coli O145:H28]